MHFGKLSYTLFSSTAMVRRKAFTISAFLLALLQLGCAASHLSSPGGGPHALSLAAVGDTTGYTIALAEGQREGIRGLLSGKDIFVFNAEGVFSKRLHQGDCQSFRHQSLFLGPPEEIDSLPRGRITVASLANNHVLDCGVEGMRETMQAFKEHGIMTVGAGGNLREACGPLMLDVKGFHVAVLAYFEMDQSVFAYIGAAPEQFLAGRDKSGVASWQSCNGQERIEELRKKADVILVLVHMHHAINSWTDTPNDASILFAKKIIDAGADIVIGSGPHVPQGIMRRDRGVSLLSLGNFLFQPRHDIPERSRRSLGVDLAISDDRINLVIVPLRLDILGQPRVALPGDADMILKRVASLSDQLGTPLRIRGERGYLEIQRTKGEGSSGADVR